MTYAWLGATATLFLSVLGAASPTVAQDSAPFQVRPYACNTRACMKVGQSGLSFFGGAVTLPSRPELVLFGVEQLKPATFSASYSVLADDGSAGFCTVMVSEFDGAVFPQARPDILAGLGYTDIAIVPPLGTNMRWQTGRRIDPIYGRIDATHYIFLKSGLTYTALKKCQKDPTVASANVGRIDNALYVNVSFDGAR